MYVTAIVLSMGTQFVKKEIVSGPRSEDSVTLCLSSLRVLTEMYIYFFCLVVLFDKKNVYKVREAIIMILKRIRNIIIFSSFAVARLI